MISLYLSASLASGIFAAVWIQVMKIFAATIIKATLVIMIGAEISVIVLGFVFGELRLPVASPHFFVLLTLSCAVRLLIRYVTSRHRLRFDTFDPPVVLLLHL